jgi:PKD repeat protein
MKNKQKLPIAVLCLSLVLLLSQCKKNVDAVKPKACFAYSNDTAYVGQSVSFTNCSELATEFNWNFGDGTTSTDFEPTHAYNTGGTYTISLTASQPGITNQTGNVQKNILVLSTTRADYIGTWNVSGESCTQSGTFSGYQIGITNGTAANAIVISNLYEAGTNILANATINGNTITIPSQTFGNGTISGSGTLSANKQSIIFTYLINSGGSSETCTATVVK